MRRLLGAAIEGNYQDEDGNTALHYAVELGYKELVRVLLQEASHSKISIELRNNQGLLAQDLTLDH